MGGLPSVGRMLDNPRHERFAKLYIKETANGGRAIDAYRKVFPKSKAFNAAAANSWRLLQNPKVKSRIMEMRMDIKRKADITFEKILTDYQEAFEMARVNEEPASMIAASREQAKLVGLLIDRKEVGAAGDFENMENISDILQAVADQAGPEAALALSKVFNLIGAEKISHVTVKAPESENSEALLEADSPSDAVN